MHKGVVCRSLVEPWVNHRLYPPPPQLEREERKEAITRFLLCGEQTPEVFRLDTVFFQNWYGYQDEAFRGGGAKMDPIQVLCVS